MMFAFMNNIFKIIKHALVTNINQQIEEIIYQGTTYKPPKDLFHVPLWHRIKGWFKRLWYRIKYRGKYVLSYNEWSCFTKQLDETIKSLEKNPPNLIKLCNDSFYLWEVSD